MSANVTVHGRRQLLVQAGERLGSRSTPSTASPATLLSRASVQLTQWPPAACCSSHADGVVAAAGALAVVVETAAWHVDATVLRKYPWRKHPAAQILAYVARTWPHAAHVNADSVGTAGDPACSPRCHALSASPGSASVLDRVDHVRSDCTAFQADAGAVLTHTRATPADLVAPQYDPVCTAASAAENATVCGCEKLASANVTVQGLRQLLRQFVGRLPQRDAPSTENADTLLSTENVHVTQCCWAEHGAAGVVAAGVVAAGVVAAGVVAADVVAAGVVAADVVAAGVVAATWVVAVPVPAVVGPGVVDSAEVAVAALVVEAAVEVVDDRVVVLPVVVAAAAVVCGAAVVGTVAAAVLAVDVTVAVAVAVAVVVAAVVEQFDHAASVDPGAHEQSAASADAAKLTVKVTPPSTPISDTAEMTSPVRATLPLYCSVLGCPVLPTRGRSALKQSPESPLATARVTTHVRAAAPIPYTRTIATAAAHRKGSRARAHSPGPSTAQALASRASSRRRSAPPLAGTGGTRGARTCVEQAGQVPSTCLLEPRSSS